MKRSLHRQIIPLLTVLFFSYLGFAIALPIFPPMFLSSNPDAIVSHSLSPEKRTLLLGFLISMYPIGQLFGGPILGKLSDIHGRKKILVISLCMIILTYFFSGFAIWKKDLWLLLLSRLLCGLFEGNSVIASATMADISTSREDKVQKFGWILTVSSLGFILGPLIGGKLADTHLVSWFNYATPFWVSGILVTIGLICVITLFQETYHPQTPSSFQLGSTIRSLFKALFCSHLKTIFLSNFFIFLSFFFFFGFFPVLLVWWYHFSATHIGEAISYLAIPICLSPFLYAFLSKHLHPKNVLSLAALLLMISLIALLFFRGPIALYFILIPIGGSIAVGWTYSSLLISDRVENNRQGEALGTNQSMTILAEICAGILGGAVAGINVMIPLMIAASFAALSALWVFFFVPKDHSHSSTTH